MVEAFVTAQKVNGVKSNAGEALHSKGSMYGVIIDSAKGSFRDDVEQCEAIVRGVYRKVYK